MIWEELGLSREELGDMPADEVDQLIVIGSTRRTLLREMAEARERTRANEALLAR